VLPMGAEHTCRAPSATNLAWESRSNAHMRVLSSEFGRIDCRKLNRLALARLKKLDQLYSATSRPIFDWNNPDWLKVQNYVGVIQVPGLSIEILPKIAPVSEAIVDPDTAARAEWSQAQRNLLFMLTAAGILPYSERGFASVEIARMPLIEALISAFGRRLIEELRRGLDRAYVGRDENLSVLRGKILIGTHLRLNALHPERLFVAYDEFNPDTMLNRILKVACQRLLRIAVLAGTQQLLRECLIDLADVEEIQITEDCFDRVYLSRNNQRFSPLLEFCRLVLIGSSPQLRAGEVTTFSLLYPMEKLFEQFIGRLIKRHAEEIGVARNQVSLQSAGHSRWLVHTLRGVGTFSLKPDILLLDRFGSVQTILDTKWKLLRRDVEDRKNGVEESDMYQVYAYAARFEARDSVLLYPAVEGVTPKEFDASDRGGIRKIRVETINLNYDLARSRSVFIQELRKILRLHSVAGSRPN
jgi:5-methylcytosine-specific restriction enzyme subunit McrC